MSLHHSTSPCTRSPPTRSNGAPSPLDRAHGRVPSACRLLRRLRARIPPVARETRANTTVEFALVLGPLMALILASLQVPLIFFESQALQSAAINAGRQIMTGTAQQGSMTQSQFQQAVCSQLNALMPCSSLMVDVESASNFGAIPTSTPTLTYKNGAVNNNWSYNPGGPDDVVIVRVMYNWPVFGAGLLPGIANQPNGQRLLVGTSIFKNEPYP
jgi:Flp pilus assembly protein TadG